MQKYLVWGGTGSLGKTLIKRLVNDNEVIIASRDELKQWTIKNEFSHKNLKFFVGDIRDYERCEQVIKLIQPDHIIIAAALKHVDVCELSPFESIKTNTLGVNNVINAVTNNIHLLENLRSVLLVSTDKSSAPINTYGMCKALSERLVTCQAANNFHCRFIGVRYGNVLESRGSIIPLFRHQAEHAQAFTITDDRMTRFVMTLDESVDLIEDAIEYAESGEIWIPRLPAMKILDLAEIFSEKYSKPIKTIGMRPGEKIHESLICSSESVRVVRSEIDLPRQRYIVKPAYSDKIWNKELFDYTSADDVMTKNQLKKRLTDLKILDCDMSTFVGRSIEEIRTNPKESK